jgi:hypothetical protein
MDALKTRCPNCGNQIEFGRDAESVICLGCQTLYRVENFKGSVGLTAISSPPATGGDTSPIGLLDARLSEIDELLAEGEAELEEVAGRRQSEPLRLGCSFFGLFMSVIVVIIAFMLIGRDYFGGWLFYLVTFALIGLWVIRLRSIWPSQELRQQLSEEYTRVEAAVSALNLERVHLAGLRERAANISPELLNPKQPPPPQSLEHK